MKAEGVHMRLLGIPLTIAAALISCSAVVADYPAPKQADWIARDFKFHTGEVLPELRLHYTTIGEPSGQAVLVLHGTGSSAAGILTADFAGQLFGPGQPLDASKYYVIIPDSIGHGKSAKPSDGLKTKFPKYDYADMIEAQHRLLADGLGVRHVRLVIGNSMGGMQTWLWGISRIHGCFGADGVAADGHGQPQLDAAAHDAGAHSQRSRI